MNSIRMMAEFFEDSAKELKEIEALSSMLAPFRREGESDVKTLERILMQYEDARDRGCLIKGGPYRGMKRHWEFINDACPDSWCNYCNRDRKVAEFYQRVMSPEYCDRMCKTCFEEWFTEEKIRERGEEIRRVPRGIDEDDVVTVQQLRQFLARVPDVNGSGEKTEVWLGTGDGQSSPCRKVWPLNMRKDENDLQSCDVILDV